MIFVQVDHDSHCYFEWCLFDHCLLSRSSEVSDMQELDDWKSYMDHKKIKNLADMSAEGFLMNIPFRAELRRSNTSDMMEF